MMCEFRGADIVTGALGFDETIDQCFGHNMPEIPETKQAECDQNSEGSDGGNGPIALPAPAFINLVTPGSCMPAQDAAYKQQADHKQKYSPARYEVRKACGHEHAVQKGQNTVHALIIIKGL